MSEVISLPISETDDRRVAYFYLQNGSNVPVTTQAGGQPQLALNSGAYSNTGIGTLVHLASGHYYATLSNFISRGYKVGDVLHTRYSAAGVIETEGSTVLISKPIYSDHHNAQSGIDYTVDASGTLNRRGIVLWYSDRYN